MEVPKEEKLRVALSIVEHLLANLYLIDVQANKHLDVIVTSYDDFKRLLLGRVKSKMNVSEEKSIKEILGKDFRRIEITYLSNFTQQVLNDIQSNEITSISIGKMLNGEQYFIKK